MAKTLEAHDKLTREIFEATYLKNRHGDKCAAGQIAEWAITTSPRISSQEGLQPCARASSL